MWSQFTKRHHSVKTVNGVMVLNLCTSPDDALYLYQFQENISKGFRIIERLRFGYLQFSKGHNSVNNVGGVIVLVLSTSSDGVLYLYQNLSKYLIGFQSYGSEQ